MDNQRPYPVALFNEIHTYFPSILYQPERFRNTSELVSYIGNQVRHHSDPFTRGAANYRAALEQQQQQQQQARPISTPPPQLRQRRNVIPSMNIPAPPIFIYEEQRLPNSAEMDVMASNLVQELLGGQRAGAGGLLNMFTGMGAPHPPQRFMDPVVVRPTAQQIAAASTIEVVEAAETEEVCAICQDTMVANSQARRLTACTHRFHTNCIDTWLSSNVVCPNCRHDIREA